MRIGYVGADKGELCNECVARLVKLSPWQFIESEARMRHSFKEYSSLEEILVFEEFDNE